MRYLLAYAIPVLTCAGCTALWGARPAVSLEADRAALAMAVDRVGVVRAGAAEAALVETGVVLDGALQALGALQAGTVGTPQPGAVEPVGATTRAHVAQELAGVRTDAQHVAALVARGLTLEQAQAEVQRHNRELVAERDRLRAALDAATAESAAVHGKLRATGEALAATAQAALGDKLKIGGSLGGLAALLLAGLWRHRKTIQDLTAFAVESHQQVKHATEERLGQDAPPTGDMVRANARTAGVEDLIEDRYWAAKGRPRPVWQRVLPRVVRRRLNRPEDEGATAVKRRARRRKKV